MDIVVFIWKREKMEQNFSALSCHITTHKLYLYLKANVILKETKYLVLKISFVLWLVSLVATNIYSGDINI